MDLEEPDDSGDDFSLDGEQETRSRSKSRSIPSAGSRSPSTSSTASTSTSESTSLRGDTAREVEEDFQTNGDGKRSSEVETEEDPIGPITPHAATFPEQRIVRGTKVKAKEKTIPGGFGDEDDDDDDDDEDLDVGGEGDIEDDWVDSGLITPPSVVSSSKSEVEVMKAESVTGEEGSKSKSKSKSGSKHRDRESRSSKSKSRRPDITSKTVPIVETTTAATTAQHYPFPSSTTGEVEMGGDRKEDDGRRIPQMRTTKARDGGRTQSGGVRGVLLTDDGDDF
jgi:cysteine protease ATG4